MPVVDKTDLSLEKVLDLSEQRAHGYTDACSDQALENAQTPAWNSRCMMMVGHWPGILVLREYKAELHDLNVTVCIKKSIKTK